MHTRPIVSGVCELLKLLRPTAGMTSLKVASTYQFRARPGSVSIASVAKMRWRAAPTLTSCRRKSSATYLKFRSFGFCGRILLRFLFACSANKTGGGSVGCRVSCSGPTRSSMMSSTICVVDSNGLLSDMAFTSRRISATVARLGDSRASRCHVADVGLATVVIFAKPLLHSGFA